MQERHELREPLTIQAVVDIITQKIPDKGVFTTHGIEGVDYSLLDEQEVGVLSRTISQMECVNKIGVTVQNGKFLTIYGRKRTRRGCWRVCPYNPNRAGTENSKAKCSKYLKADEGLQSDES